MDKAAADESLMSAYRDGDSGAFETLYRRHKGPVFRYLLRQCRIPAVAEELFHDVWVGLINAKERYQPTAKFTTYLYRLAHNRLIDYYRRQSTGIPISYDDDPDDPVLDHVADREEREPENELDRKRQRQKLLELIGQLPEAQREAFLLREEGDLTLVEIAAATGVNPETVKSRLRYAVAKLREGLQLEQEGA
ncbi:MAG: RNA polymerase sigma factor [Sulfuricaulis sp.]